MSFSNPGNVKIYDAKNKRKRYYFARTVGDGRTIALTELKKRVEEDMYKGTDLAAAKAIIESPVRADESEAAQQFLNARKYMKGEGYTVHECEEMK